MGYAFKLTIFQTKKSTVYSNGHVNNIFENVVELSGIEHDLSFREPKRWFREILHFNECFIA